MGSTETAARIMPALAALALVGATAWFAVRLLSADVAFVAVLLLSTSPGMFGLARYAILDTLFSMFVFGGASLVTVAALKQRPALQWPGYLLIAAAVLTKGPLALLLCGLAFLLALALAPEARERLLGLRWVTGLVLTILLAAPWFLYMWHRFGNAFVDGYVLDENFRLYTRSRYASASAWFYFRVLAAGLLPWTALLVGRLYDDVRAMWRRDGSADAVDVLLWSWTCAIVGFFTFSSFKLDHYVFPAAPALCLIVARAWASMRQRPQDPRNTGARVGVHLVGPLMVAVAFGGGYLLVARLGLPPGAIIVPIVFGAAGASLTAYLNVTGGRPPRTPWMVVGAMTVTYAGLLIWVMPALEQRKVVPDLARWVSSRTTATDRVATYRLNRWNTAFRFYVGRHVRMIDSPDEARTLFAGSEAFYCAMLGPAYEEFVAQGVPLRVVYERDGLWATSGRALWRRRIPPTRFVIVTSAR
jgi:4-amino-4-deoxy-L-arabinose transferase-like glycosyltransferase